MIIKIPKVVDFKSSNKKSILKDLKTLIKIIKKNKKYSIEFEDFLDPFPTTSDEYIVFNILKHNLSKNIVKVKLPHSLIENLVNSKFKNFIVSTIHHMYNILSKYGKYPLDALDGDCLIEYNFEPHTNKKVIENLTMVNGISLYKDITKLEECVNILTNVKNFIIYNSIEYMKGNLLQNKHLVVSKTVECDFYVKLHICKDEKSDRAYFGLIIGSKLNIEYMNYKNGIQYMINSMEEVTTLNIIINYLNKEIMSNLGN